MPKSNLHKNGLTRELPSHLAVNADDSVVLSLFRKLTRHFSLGWLACIPLAAIITIVWGTAAMARSEAIDQAAI